MVSVPAMVSGVPHQSSMHHAWRLKIGSDWWRERRFVIAEIRKIGVFELVNL
jgi:hypothetical protein